MGKELTEVAWANLLDRVTHLEQIASAPRVCTNCEHCGTHTFENPRRTVVKCLFRDLFIVSADHDAPRCPHWTFNIKKQLESMADAIDPATH